MSKTVEFIDFLPQIIRIYSAPRKRKPRANTIMYFASLLLLYEAIIVLCCDPFIKYFFLWQNIIGKSSFYMPKVTLKINQNTNLELHIKVVQMFELKS